MKRKLRIALLMVAVLALAGAGVGMMMYYKPHKDFATASVDVTITAKDILAAFDADEVNAQWAYVKGDKTILVTGTLRETGRMGDGAVELVLDAGAGSVSCAMMPDQAAKAGALTPGVMVRIKGQCTGMQELVEKQVIMIRCALAE